MVVIGTFMLNKNWKENYTKERTEFLKKKKNYYPTSATGTSTINAREIHLLKGFSPLRFSKV